LDQLRGGRCIFSRKNRTHVCLSISGRGPSPVVLRPELEKETDTERRPLGPVWAIAPTHAQRPDRTGRVSLQVSAGGTAGSAVRGPIGRSVVNAAVMSTLAVVATFANHSAAVGAGPAAQAVRMIAALPARCPDGTAFVAAAGAGLGFGKLVVSAQQGHALSPLVDAQSGLSLVADVRIDNRDDLRAQLALAAQATDAEIVMAGFRRWGEQVVHRLIGDFAFAVWDEGRRRLFAARDPFGVRPLVYRVLQDRVLVASDVEQILAVDPSARQVDDASVVDLLLYRRISAERTYWEPIKNVPAGHSLSVDARGGGDSARPAAVRIARWWFPAVPVDPIRDERAGLEEFRQVFARAVSDRLRSDHPILIHLSGGFDSSVIALVAGQLGALAPLLAVGAVHPGLACDESVYINATAARLPYPFESWDGTQPDLIDLENPCLAGPGLRIPRTNGSARDLTIAARQGARVVLEGLGGDGMHPVWDVVRDFAAAGRWDLVLRATVLAQARSWRSRARLSWTAIKRLAPQRLRRWRGHLRRAPAPPAWLAPEFHGLVAAGPESAGAGLAEHVSTIGAGGAARLYEFMRPLSVQLVNNEQRAFAEIGTECRCPFLDVRLLALMDRLPLSSWRPPLYQRRLHAVAYADLLPTEVRTRQRKTVFASAVANRLRIAAPTAISMLSARQTLLSSRFLVPPPRELVERGCAVAGAIAGSNSDSSWQECALALNVAALEAWLRIV
jgi:asparagine synthase (glutamine-hydrolysing)